MSLENGTIRILRPDGSTAGTGFLVTHTLAVTCAHVVDGPDAIVQAKFTGHDETFSAQVLHEYYRDPQNGDIAFLRLEKVPEDSTPLRLGTAEGSLAGRPFLTFGYAAGSSGTEGRYIHDSISGSMPEILRNEQLLSLRLERWDPGYSGAPVWDEQRGLVVGMIVGTSGQQQLKNTVQAVSARVLWQICPEVPSPDWRKSAKPPAREEPPIELPRAPVSNEEAAEDREIDKEMEEAGEEWKDEDEFEDDEDDEGDGGYDLPELSPEISPPASVQPAPRPRPRARRVLNLNFAAGDDHHVLELNEPLRPGEMYDLLVDVGLPWDKIHSLLRGNAVFPEDSEVSYLTPADRQKGWFDVEAVFVSQEFEPNLVSGRMRIPVGSSERSTPYLDGNLGKIPGPLRLRVSPRQTVSRRAHGRLCLYYGAQVLQSAVIDVGVRPARRRSRAEQTAENTAVVDYVLTPGFANVGQNISQRRRPAQDGKITETTVKVGLMLNDDLAGTHRILLKLDDESGKIASLPPAWKAYDSTAIGEILAEARRILANPSAKQPDYASDTFMLDKFKADLIALAKLGAGLYNMLLQGLTPADGVTPLVWRKKFRSALQPGDVIQLARAGSVPSTHIIPWALVYDHPLELDRSDLPLTLCRVVDEQWDSDLAKRKQPFSARETLTCPYEREHKTNTVCPFSFWGYKYTLEQPISALLGKNWDVEPARRILASAPVKMAVAATQDVPRESRRKQHFQAIQNSLNAEYIPAIPAGERDQVRDSLRAPQLVYILCHGGKDGKITYLSIGPRGADARYTITPELPGSWGENDYIDVEKWAETRPLVFINGCYTTDLLPELTLNFVSAFRDLLAGGVVGTEIPVTVEHGYLAAEKFFERLGRGEDVGQAILGMRWDLLNQGSFLGLAYTPYAMADLHLER